MSTLRKIEGISDVYAKKLHHVGLRSQADLLQFCGRVDGRHAIARRSGISEKLILEWVNRADLARIYGIGEEYADLLEHCGVDSVPELAERRAENLYQKLIEVNNQHHYVRRLPTLNQVKDWIFEAKTLPRGVYH